MQVFKHYLKETGKVVLFFTILLVLLSQVSNIVLSVSKKDENLIESRDKAYIRIQREPKNTIDTLIVGDSLTYTSFSPMQIWQDYGIASFVSGQSGQKIQESYSMVKNAFENQKIKLVVMETNVLFRSQTGMSGVKNNVEQKWNDLFPVFRFHDVWKSWIIDRKYLEECFKGFMLYDSVNAYEGGVYMSETTAEEKITDSVSEGAKSLIELCKENGADVLLVSVPSPANYNYQRHNALARFARENKVAYLDMNLDTDAVGIDWKSDTADKGDHLNFSGADKVSRYFGKYLNEHYQLENHQGEKAYQDWDVLLQEYITKSEAKLQSIRQKL